MEALLKARPSAAYGGIVEVLKVLSEVGFYMRSVIYFTLPSESERAILNL